MWLLFVACAFVATSLSAGQQEERRKMAMCVDHDDSIHGKYWSEVQTEVFNNRFEEGADCDLGDPANAFPICSDEASGVSSTISERKRRLYKRRYDRLCAQGLPEASEGCCIKRVNGKLMGVYGEATLPCLEERDIPGHTCQAMEWADRKHCICNLITGRMPIPECSVDSHCPAGKKMLLDKEWRRLHHGLRLKQHHSEVWTHV